MGPRDWKQGTNFQLDVPSPPERPGLGLQDPCLGGGQAGFSLCGLHGGFEVGLCWRVLSFGGGQHSSAGPSEPQSPSPAPRLQAVLGSHVGCLSQLPASCSPGWGGCQARSVWEAVTREAGRAAAGGASLPRLGFVLPPSGF